MDKLQLSMEIVAILINKKNGIDCDEDESATLKAFLRLMDKELRLHHEVSPLDKESVKLLVEVRYYFPQEFSEVVDELGEEKTLFTLSRDFTDEGIPEPEDEKEENETVSADEVINRIADVLRESDGKWIEKIANQVLTEQYRYTEDSVFVVTNPKGNS